MSKQSFYILKNGTIKRKDNNVTMISEDGLKKDLKIEVARDIYLFGEVNLNTKFLNYTSQMKVPIHVFNYYGFYSGTYYPRDSNVSGRLLVKQVEYYQNDKKRLGIAKEFIDSASHNIYRNLRYYNERDKDLGKQIELIKGLRPKIKKCEAINELMGIEGNIRKNYYTGWNIIVNQEIDFNKRVKRPPDNMINSLISFINSLIYTTILSEIYKTQLNPTISYLHEVGDKRFSLCLDIAEIFKPLIGDRLIFTLLNKRIITEKSFDEGSNFYYLKDKERLKILKLYDERLKSTIMHKTLRKQVSYRHLMRLECYKLIKHLQGDKEYEGFKIWW